MTTKGKVKGAQLLGRMRFVRALGAEAWRRVLGALSLDDRELLLREAVQPTAWYGAEVLLRLDEAIAAETGRPDRAALLVALGRFAAETSFGPTGTLRAHVGQSDPHALLREVPRVHAALQGAGARGYARTGPQAAVVRSVRLHRSVEGDCLTNVGWLRRAIELCGGRDVQVEETGCVGRGGSCCEYRCEWR
jgi:uncharacterized protein (TIGR02265 family)